MYLYKQNKKTNVNKSSKNSQNNNEGFC